MNIRSLPRAWAGAASAATAPSKAMRGRGCSKGRPDAERQRRDAGQCRNAAGGRQPGTVGAKIPRLGEVIGSWRPILTTVRIVLPGLSPQGASGKLATFLRQSFLHQAARSLHPGRFSLGLGLARLAICVGARLDSVASRL